jgi:hypothetical protein
MIFVTIHQVIQKAGFEVANTWNDLTGSPYYTGGEWIAIAALRPLLQ